MRRLLVVEDEPLELRLHLSVAVTVGGELATLTSSSEVDTDDIKDAVVAPLELLRWRPAGGGVPVLPLLLVVLLSAAHATYSSATSSAAGDLEALTMAALVSSSPCGTRRVEGLFCDSDNATAAAAVALLLLLLLSTDDGDAFSVEDAAAAAARRRFSCHLADGSGWDARRRSLEVPRS